MPQGSLRCYCLALLISPLNAASLLAQEAPKPRPEPVTIEPGLEAAVNWKWWVAPSEEKDWGLFPPAAARDEPSEGSGDTVAPKAAIPARPDTYEVKRGDALSIIARKFTMSVAQLKEFNDLESDLIRIGQTLKIPTIDELVAMAPPPKVEPAESEENGETTEAPAKKLPAIYDFTRETRTVLLQSFLDRKNFSSGPIDGYPGAMFEKARELYESAQDGGEEAEILIDQAVRALGEPYTRYTLRPEDFRFITPPEPTGRGSKSDALPEPLPFEELIVPTHLAYRTPWEFVAERFHCAERFLRSSNSKIKGMPKPGTVFKVPNVIPFEIENAFEAPLQPEGDAAENITAAVVDLKRIEISKDGKLVAAFPMSLARPDLRGRGTWGILDAIPRPRLVTKAEPKDGQRRAPVTTSSSEPGATGGERAKPFRAVLANEQDLAAGPNNPLGLFWINLAKSDSTEPLPYGLHGTSIPGRMNTQESIGGLRLANWDIVRAVRMLPPGTPLQWK